MEWVLVVFIYAGIFAQSDSVAISNIPSFTSKQLCEQAGIDLSRITSSTFKEIRTKCIRNK